MLDKKILSKLQTLKELPTIPFVINEVLNAIEKDDIRASQLAQLVERDQTLTARVLRVANSPFYGFSRRIATIELAVVLLGFNTIKEIVISLILQNFFSRVRTSLLNTREFWEYSVFCGSAARLLARKLGYRLAGEAFVAGLMHDIGILIIGEFFSKQFAEIRKLQNKNGYSLNKAEITVLNCTHSDIGAWFAEKWNLPSQLVDAITYHHSDFAEAIELKKAINSEKNNSSISSEKEESFDQPLTAIVSMSEWFAFELGFKNWSFETENPQLYLANEILSELSDHDVLNPNSAIEVIKQEILEEYNKASEFQITQSKYNY